MIPRTCTARQHVWRLDERRCHCGTFERNDSPRGMVRTRLEFTAPDRTEES